MKSLTNAPRPLHSASGENLKSGRRAAAMFISKTMLKLDFRSLLMFFGPQPLLVPIRMQATAMRRMTPGVKVQ
jgi:hypothetical protein